MFANPSTTAIKFHQPTINYGKSLNQSQAKKCVDEKLIALAGGLLFLSFIILLNGYFSWFQLGSVDSLVSNQVIEKAAAINISKNIIFDSSQIYNLVKEYLSVQNQSRKIAIDILIRDEIRTIQENLTKQLLTFSRGGEPVKRTLSIVDLVKEAAGFALSGSVIKCEFEVNTEIAPIIADKGQIYQVINNIILNARQAMAHGGEKVIASLRKDHPDIKAIVSSGYSNDPIMAGYRKYGFKGIITKPYKIENLIKALRNILEEEQ